MAIRKARPTPTTIRVGGLKDAMAKVAGSVVHTLCDGLRAVWADDLGEVYSSMPDSCTATPAHWIAGTFTLGQPVADIEEDLRELARTHVSTLILPS